MEVRQKQRQLYFLGFLEEEKEVDGVWGPRSAGATMAFQETYGITADGIFGPNTQEKSREIIQGIQEAVEAYLGRNVTADGLAGPETMAAVEAYQKSVGLEVTGIAGVDTRKWIAEEGRTLPQGETREEDWWREIEYFTPEEFRCRCGRYCDGYPARMRKEVVQIAEAARRHFGRPGIVVSGLRCKRHNANVGGVVNSQHLYGEAVDLRIQGVSGAALLAFVQGQKGVRYAYQIDQTNVHFDVPKGVR